MFQWRKAGLVFSTAQHSTGEWMNNSALTPTPIKLSEEEIRVYAGFRDKAGVSRIGFVDVRSDDPTSIVRVSRNPVLDIGRAGCFDDNGVILGDVVARPDGLYMFYVGFQQVAKAKFLAFTGLARSTDKGDSFSRLSEAPILGRGPAQTTIGAVHSAMVVNGRWKIWYASGDDWEYIAGKPFPQYHIRYVESDDLMNLPRSGQVCLKPQGTEYRIGRPRVYRAGGKYLMYFTYGTTDGAYLPGVAWSDDGREWVRKDSDLGISLGQTGWDSRTLCYPTLVNGKNDLVMFYNGNDMGADGFGVALADGVITEANS